MGAGTETNTGEETVEQLHAQAEQVKERVEQGFEQHKGAVSRQIDGLAQALRTTAKQCDRQPDGQYIAGYARYAADGVEQIGQVLEGKTLSDVLNDLQRVSRERPLLVGAAALAAGLFGARVTRTSVSVHRRETERETKRETETDAERTARLADFMQSDGGI